MKKKKQTSQFDQTITKKLEIFENIIRKENIKQKVIGTRKKLGIPVNGLDYEKYGWSDKVNKIHQEEKGVLVDCALFIEDKIRQESELAKDYSEMIENYIIFNTRSPSQIKSSVVIESVADEETTYEEIVGDGFVYDWLNDANRDWESKGRLSQKKDYLAKNYPIRLYLNPYISRRDLEDFIKKNWNLIKGKQGIFLGEEKRKRTRKRDETSRKISDFIWQNKDLSKEALLNNVRYPLFRQTFSVLGR